MDAAALLCNICPRGPRFSDVSHLLTHVSSKAHLSHYFKLQVRSHQEPDIGALLDGYDTWYRVNNLAKLLADRLSSKDARKKKPHPTKRTTCPSMALPNYVDPRLADPYLETRLSTGYKQETRFDSEEERGLLLPRKMMEDAVPSSQYLAKQLTYDPFIEGTDKDRTDEISRLKGVLWPGMDIFDSATEQMKRKRNQKKDESLLKKMERTSLCVEPTELVFSPTGALRKQRVISGNVEDSSPLKGETPIPRRRAKRALAQADSNIQCGQDRKKIRKNPKYTSNKVEARVNQSGLSFMQTSLNQVPVYPTNVPSREDDSTDFELTYLEHDSGLPRSGLYVYREGLHTSTVDHSQPMTGASAATDLHYLRYEATSSDILPFLHVGNCGSSARFSTDKENIEPLLNHHGRIDPLIGWQSPTPRRNITTETVYPPHCSYPFENDKDPIGFSYNPLVGSSAKLVFEEHAIYTTETNNFLASDIAAKATSPNATISDLEDDGFERLYLDGSSC
ncbi:hypothetical protein FE257_012112 [Aspergillus nanangensis]|uniref:Uncharacterized protein n=1 Tax=Aspergillus nanangensis TaxID=2582783 RepID=A0AAD4CGG2_ASPNN|nr:hypothetical protein FE257_012112 [Aspergillus nanangensis]